MQVKGQGTAVHVFQTEGVDPNNLVQSPMILKLMSY